MKTFALGLLGLLIVAAVGLAQPVPDLPLGMEIVNVRLIAFGGSFDKTCSGRTEWVGEYVQSWHEINNSGGGGTYIIKGVPADVSSIIIPGTEQAYGDVICVDNKTGKETVLTMYTFPFDQVFPQFDGPVFFGPSGGGS